MKKVYLGAGKDRKEGWIHLDIFPFEGIDVICDVTKGLPFEDNSIDHIYSQDFMEHLPTESKVFVINEIWRVLKNGGTMEHYIPNAGSRNDFGSPSHLSHWNLQQFEHFDVDSYRYEKDSDYEGTKAKFRKVLAEKVNWQKEDGGINLAQSIHVIYEKIGQRTAFIVLQLGSPHEWSQQYIDHLAQQKQYGYYWKIVTPNKYDNVPDNVEIIDMNIEQFNELCEKKLGVKPSLRILERGIPSFHITDTMIFWGTIFEDYLKGFDFWGLIGLDCVVGRLDHFIKDFDFDIYSDDRDTFNGNFSILKNIPKVNELWRNIKNWELIFQQPDCPGCLQTGEHHLYGTDEYGMTIILNDSPDIKFIYPHFFIHGHDRLEIHQPTPKLEILEDGTLWEKINDVNPPHWMHMHQNFAHEIAYFHFQKTKTWPI